MIKSARWLAVVLALVFLCACGKTEDASEVLGTFSATDMRLKVSGTVYAFGEDAAPLLSTLGDPADFTQAKSCRFDGYDKIYYYTDMEIYTFPSDGKDILDEVRILTDRVPVKGGVHVGSSQEDVIAAYGDGYYTETDLMTYSESRNPEDSSAAKLSFQIKDGKVVVIDFYSNCYFQ